jgi:small subunit ribosomal protein S6
MVERYQSMVTGNGGQVHRFEDWGRRQLAHSINKIHKAHYVLMNVECEQSVLDEIQSAFKFNDAVLRHLVIRRDEAVTEASHLARSEEELAEKPARETEVAVSAEAPKEAEAEAPKATEAEAPKATEAEAPKATEAEAPKATEAEAPKEDEAAVEAPAEIAAAPADTPDSSDGDDTSDASSEKTAG